MAASETSDTRFIEEVFWIVLGRAPSDVERREVLHEFNREHPETLLKRLLSSPEFHNVRAAWKAGREASPDPDGKERGLRALAPDEPFVRRAYESLLGRPPDDPGLRHYTQGLARGDRRTDFLRWLTLSDEFERRYQALAPATGFIPRDVQLCELANPAKWENEEWLTILRSLGLAEDKLSMHRKSYEFTQLIFGCRRLGALREDSRIVSVGAGHEIVLYWLANHAARVVATDMYQGVWQDVQSREGDPDVTRRPQDYAPFPYREDHLAFLKMDGRFLAFADGTFDIAYSLSSIEHFGGVAGARSTIREMARVLKPGGILALATEYVLAGPPHEETFQPSELAELIADPSLELVEPIDDRVYKRYEHVPIDLYGNPYQAPHMVVRFNDTVFTTVMVFLRRR